ncbi:MAG: oligo-1,6-glucosidase [Patescibacteria group bacterium]|nr:MAG: oligo-1,6-glucosidase [Patescibacteria group bacterium]
MSDFMDWRNAVIYEVWPRSFFDSNHDGSGDIAGLISKLAYFKELGIDVLWLGPVYQSSWVDAGYDVDDHTAIDPLFGNMQDLQRLIYLARQNHLKVMLDMVVNHTSIRHRWFQESSSSRNNSKADWYIWADGSRDSPPNNWLSVFGGSAWEFVPQRQQYYLHTFYKEQPDLNWQNPHLRRAIYDLFRYYLRMGVEGLRIDAASHLAKDPLLCNNPLRSNAKRIHDPYEKQKHLYDKNLPERFKYINEMSQVLSEFPGTFMFTESYLGLRQLQQIHGQTSNSNHTAYNFNLIEIPFKPQIIYQSISTYLEIVAKHQAIPNWTLSNHDRQRLVSRVGPMRARLLAMLQMALPGIAFIYYGEEIGMSEVHIPAQLRYDRYAYHDRDAQRTPMQWSNQQYAGFSDAPPWLPVGDSTYQNFATQYESPSSIWHLYRTLINFKKATGWQMFETQLNATEHILEIDRKGHNEHYRIILNFSTEVVKILEPLPQTKPVISTYLDRDNCDDQKLRPFEGVILSL